jgi:hypothetical protein
MKKTLTQIAWLSVMVILSAQAPKLEFEVSVNAKAVPKRMSSASVADLFLLRRQYWANREPVVLVLQTKDSELNSAFCEKILELPCDSIDQVELERRYQGTLFARIIRVATAADAAVMLQQTANSIAYFRSGKTPTQGARVVLQK